MTALVVYLELVAIGGPFLIATMLSWSSFHFLSVANFSIDDSDYLFQTYRRPECVQYKPLPWQQESAHSKAIQGSFNEPLAFIV